MRRGPAQRASDAAKGRTAMPQPAARKGLKMTPKQTTFDWRFAIQEGMYPVSFAAKLSGMTNARVASWFATSEGSRLAPAIITPFAPLAGQIVMPFLALVETRFVAHFRKHGLSLQTIRKAARKLRDRHHMEHPFATNTRFRTDGRKIMEEEAADDGERRLLDIMTDEWAFPNVVEPSLFESVVYIDDLAVRMTPFPEFPDVIVDPRYALGRPVVQPNCIPTATLAAAYLAEGDVDDVADWFGTAPAAITQSVGFEQRLAA